MPKKRNPQKPVNYPPPGIESATFYPDGTKKIVKKKTTAQKAAQRKKMG